MCLWCAAPGGVFTGMRGLAGSYLTTWLRLISCVEQRPRKQDGRDADCKPLNLVVRLRAACQDEIARLAINDARLAAVSGDECAQQARTEGELGVMSLRSTTASRHESRVINAQGKMCRHRGACLSLRVVPEPGFRRGATSSGKVQHGTPDRSWHPAQDLWGSGGRS